MWVQMVSRPSIRSPWRKNAVKSRNGSVDKETFAGDRNRGSAHRRSCDCVGAVHIARQGVKRRRARGKKQYRPKQ